MPRARRSRTRPGRRSIRCPSRRLAPLLALLLLAATGCERPVPASEIPARLAALGRPDLVLILVDTLRADALTPYGGGDTTPEVARWADRGVLFEEVRAQSSWTKISMASLLTSLWPRSHGITEAEDGLSQSAVTLAEVLRDGGYATYGVQTNGWLDQSFGFQQGFDRYVVPRGAGGPAWTRASVWPHADNVLAEAQRILDGRDPDKPLFLYLHFMDVHEYASPPEFKIYGTDERGTYRAATHWVDDALGRLRGSLDDAGVLDRAVVVLAADHGETFGEHGIHGHARNVLTPVIHVPMVFRFPFPVQPRRVHTQVRNLDLAPTLVELAGLPVPPSFEGESLVPLMTGAADEPDRPSFAGLGIPLFADSSVQHSYTDGAWTYARNEPAVDNPKATFKPVAPGAEFLFDRSVDPGENANLIHIEPAQAERMRAILDAHLAGKELGVKESGVRIDPAIADRLRAMGYLR